MGFHADIFNSGTASAVAEAAGVRAVRALGVVGSDHGFVELEDGRVTHFGIARDPVSGEARIEMWSPPEREAAR